MSIARSTTPESENASGPLAAATRRRFLSGAAAFVAAPWLARGARAADVPRFPLGVASGQPRADGVVLWTRLLGEALPDRVLEHEPRGQHHQRGAVTDRDPWVEATEAQLLRPMLQVAIELPGQTERANQVTGRRPLDGRVSAVEDGHPYRGKQLG